MTIERKRLSPEQTITLGNDKYTISGIRGNGTSSIVYDAKTYIEALNKEKKVLIKELFPVNLNIRRDSVGALIIPKASADLFKKYKESFKNAAKLQLEFHNPSEDADPASSTNSTSNLENLYESGNTLYSVMSLDDGQTYEEYKNNDLRSHIEICRNLADAIRKYHERGYLHLDIKPENIFVLSGSNHIKLFDFDTVQRKEDINNCNCQVTFTNEYAPPELELTTISNAYYSNLDERTDIYMIGATLFDKLFNCTPSLPDRFPFQTWDFDESEVAKTASTQVKDKITDLFRKTIAQLQEGRYNDVSELICAFDCILDLLKFKYNLVNQNIYKTSGDCYIPRTQEIKQIRNILNEKHIAYLYGMGGIGKSETARAYAEEYRNDYSVIQLVSYYSDLAKAIASLSFSDDEGFNDNAQNEDDRYKMVFTRLSDKLLNNERTLIIIDNYNYISDAAKDISEKDQRVLETNRKVLQDLTKLSIHFIFTTRNKPLPHDIKKGVEIKEFTSDELRELFFSINPICKDEPKRIKKVDKILELTGYHTLTVDLIARQSASIEGMGNHTLDDLIDVISRSGMNNEVDVIVPNNKDEKDTYDIVYNHIKALFDFTQLSVIEEYVLATAALLPVTGMKEKDFCELIALDKVSNQPTGWGLNKTITKLVESGWLRRSGYDTVTTSMHPIIADVACNELKYLYNTDLLDYFYRNLSSAIYPTSFADTAAAYRYTVYETIKKIPFNHNNFTYISFLFDRLLIFFPNIFEIYWEKAEYYIMSSKNINQDDKLSYLIKLFDKYTFDPIRTFFSGRPEAQEHKNKYYYLNTEKAKDAASLSLEYSDTLLDNFGKACLASKFASELLSVHDDYDAAIHYGRIALDNYKLSNDDYKVVKCLSDLRRYFDYWFDTEDSLTESQIIEQKQFLSDIDNYIIELSCIDLDLDD